MEKITINAEKREKFGKGAARSLRRNNIIPAVLYRGGGSIPIQFSRKEFTQFINTAAGKQTMVNIQFADGDSRLALMKDFQLDPIRGDLIHADFFEVSLTEKVKVTIPITTTGEPVGVKRDKGILQHLFREIEIECLPDKIPGKIEIDISELEIGQSFHVSDLKIGEDIKILTNPEEVIATILAPAVEEVAPAAAEVAAPEAGVTEVTEPEVIKKGKEEKVEEEEKGKEKEKK
jgi:large subunit ribosomal protein L25